MLQAVTWRDLHLYCWCYAGCISQMCDCEQLKQSNIHWCISTCLGCNFKWKRVSLSNCVCLFVCLGLHSIAYSPHFHSYLSSLCMANHECTHPALKSWQCVCVDVKHQRVSGITTSLSSCFWYPKEEQREAGILRRFWGFPLSFCVMRVAEVFNKRPKEEKRRRAMLFRIFWTKSSFEVIWDHFISSRLIISEFNYHKNQIIVVCEHIFQSAGAEQSYNASTLDVLVIFDVWLILCFMIILLFKFGWKDIN